MALRIAGKKQEETAPVAEEMPVEEMPAEEAPIPEEEIPMEEEVPVEEPMAGGSGILDAMAAGYKGPELGPFMCQNCQYFMNGGCQIVAGPIDPEGICNVYMPIMPEEEALPEEEMPVEEAPVEELPEEEPVV